MAFPSPHRSPHTRLLFQLRCWRSEPHSALPGGSTGGKEPVAPPGQRVLPTVIRASRAEGAAKAGTTEMREGTISTLPPRPRPQWPGRLGPRAAGGSWGPGRARRRPPLALSTPTALSRRPGWLARQRRQPGPRSQREAPDPAQGPASLDVQLCTLGPRPGSGPPLASSPPTPFGPVAGEPRRPARTTSSAAPSRVRSGRPARPAAPRRRASWSPPPGDA